MSRNLYMVCTKQQSGVIHAQMFQISSIGTTTDKQYKYEDKQYEDKTENVHKVRCI